MPSEGCGSPHSDPASLLAQRPSGGENATKQNEIDEFETPTKGYSLLFAGIGSDFLLLRQRATLYMLAENLFDQKYVSHLNRLKEYGILNPGRNITLGLNIHFGLRK